jgi:NADH-quinone oxidoreductase subunit M
VLAGIVGLAAGLYALQSGAERLKIYLMLLLVMQGGLMGVFASVDIFFFYFFHELALIPTFIMVGIWGTAARPRYAAMKMTIYLTARRDAVADRPDRDLREERRGLLRPDHAARNLSRTRCGRTAENIFGLLMFGFGILVSLWPLHTWAPLGYGAAPSSAAMLHAGVLKKFGLYGLIQIALPLLPGGVPPSVIPLPWRHGTLGWRWLLASATCW